MAGFEDLIRSAIEKQGNLTAEGREGIYNSSRQALERMLSKNPALDQNAATAQRQRLQKAIVEIESSYAKTPVSPSAPTPPATPPPPPQRSSAPVPKLQTPAPVPTPEPKPEPIPQAVPVPAQSGDLSSVAPNRPAVVQPPLNTPVDSQPPQRVEPQMEVPEIPIPAHAKDTAEVALEPEPFNPMLLQQRKKRPYAKLLLWTIIWVGIGVAGWWAWTFGPDLIKSRLDGSVPNPNPVIESGEFVPAGGEGWVNVFEPDANPQDIDLANRSSAELIQAEGRTFARISSNAGNSGNTVLVKIPRGVLETLKGEAATFEVLLRSSDDEPQQFAIFCEFKSMGSCGRKRFTARKQTEAYIFDVLVNEKMIGRNQSAHMAFNTDLALGGQPLDLYSIRVRVDK